MGRIVRKNFDAPDEVRKVEGGMGHIELVNVEDGAVGRATFRPGWRWSEHVRPIAGTESCQVAHVGYQISGRMGVRLDDGEEMEFGPGDFVSIPAGHDGWVIGDETVVMIDWQGMAGYAKK
ncbi:MAG TPA: cupin domain-containing protein [Mycobacteriales bacterium]|jgi:quercetin dioxygenase-like cupin family protein|nr:cupin domain-containing protein [Mycobacteriales bacterium]